MRYFPFFITLFIIFHSSTVASAQVKNVTIGEADSDYKKELYSSAIAKYQAVHSSAATYLDLRAKANLGMARCWLEIWNFEKAIPPLKEAERDLVNKELKGDILQCLGQAYNDKMDPDSATFWLDKAQKVWGIFPDLEREIRWRNEKSKALLGSMKIKECFAVLKDGESKIELDTSAVSAYERAHFYGMLMVTYDQLGWNWKKEEATKRFLNTLQKISDQTFRWGRVVLAFHDLLPFQLGDELTQKVEKIFYDKFKEADLCRAKVDWERIKGYQHNNLWQKKDIAVQSTFKTYYGYKSIIYANYLSEKAMMCSGSDATKLILESTKINNLRSTRLYRWNLFRLALSYDNLLNVDSTLCYSKSLEQYLQGHESTLMYARLLSMRYYSMQLSNPSKAINDLLKAEAIVQSVAGDSSSVFMESKIYPNLIHYYSGINDTISLLRIQYKTEVLAIKMYGRYSMRYFTEIKNLADYYETLGRYTNKLKLYFHLLNVVSDPLFRGHPNEVQWWKSKLNKEIAETYKVLGNQYLSSFYRNIARGIQVPRPPSRSTDKVDSLSFELGKCLNNDTLPSFNKQLAEIKQSIFFELNRNSNASTIESHFRVCYQLCDYYSGKYLVDSFYVYLNRLKTLNDSYNHPNNKEQLFKIFNREEFFLIFVKGASIDSVIQKLESYTPYIEKYGNVQELKSHYSKLGDRLHESGNIKKGDYYNNLWLGVSKKIAFFNPKSIKLQIFYYQNEISLLKPYQKSRRKIYYAKIRDLLQKETNRDFEYYNTLGDCFLEKNMIDSALVSYKSGLKGIESKKPIDVFDLSNICIKVGDIYLNNLNNLDSARHYYLVPIIEFYKRDIELGILIQYMLLGYKYISLAQYDQSEETKDFIESFGFMFESTDDDNLLASPK